MAMVAAEEAAAPTMYVFSGGFLLNWVGRRGGDHLLLPDSDAVDTWPCLLPGASNARA